MPSIISTIGYITEVNTTTSINSNTTITRGIIACNRPEQNGSLFVNFVKFNNTNDNKDTLIELIICNHVYLLHGKFVYNKIKKPNSETCEELQVNKFKFKSL